MPLIFAAPLDNEIKQFIRDAQESLDEAQSARNSDHVILCQALTEAAIASAEMALRLIEQVKKEYKPEAEQPKPSSNPSNTL